MHHDKSKFGTVLDMELGAAANNADFPIIEHITKGDLNGYSLVIIICLVHRISGVVPRAAPSNTSEGIFP